MNKSEQMVFEWYSPVVQSPSTRPSSHSPEIKKMLLNNFFGDCRIPGTGTIARPFKNHLFEFALKGAMDCIIMAGGVLFAALTTLLLWL